MKKSLYRKMYWDPAKQVYRNQKPARITLPPPLPTPDVATSPAAVNCWREILTRDPNEYSRIRDLLIAMSKES